MDPFDTQIPNRVSYSPSRISYSPSRIITLQQPASSRPKRAVLKMNKEESKILHTMATQVAEMYKELPIISKLISIVQTQVNEHERRIMQLEHYAVQSSGGKFPSVVQPEPLDEARGHLFPEMSPPKVQGPIGPDGLPRAEELATEKSVTETRELSKEESSALSKGESSALSKEDKPSLG
jgi:hypothetical protein